MIERVKNEILAKEMKECTFKPNFPRTTRSPSPKASIPQGYMETITRLRSAARKKEETQKIKDEVGKPKLFKQKEDGKTIVKPFKLKTADIKLERIKDRKPLQI